MKKKMSSKHMEEYEHMSPRKLKKHMREEKTLLKHKKEHKKLVKKGLERGR